ncbi:protein FAR1-RELATED SEQUENCE 5-like [Juglans microcarpa x Juglans regia]|uniref:protein FAR1-RELATED SEQUENCE 5-like n=1 Tax=Juglans microcarpa x Juglans regia TaxID=2249226 RepID=UPI001B7DDE4D|nr:protein FAR1-RELATED SEQUENCE 5-like [Juglans microcarpa x Juglans regia]
MIGCKIFTTDRRSGFRLACELHFVPYKKALDARYFNEKEKDVRKKSTKPVLKTYWKIEEEATKVYTRKSFSIFQDEPFNCQQYKATKVQTEGESKMYILCVFMKKSNLDSLPHQYVLERWTINAKSQAIHEIPNSDVQVSTHEDPIMRKSHLMMQF